MSTFSFRRHEKKYLITEAQRDLLLSAMKDHMRPDEYCPNGRSYLVRSIYYDTDDNHLIRLSIQKPTYKEKIRVRKYGRYRDGRSDCFLELKKKTAGMVTKRRIACTLDEATAFIEKGAIPSRDTYIEKQIIEEFRYFLSNYQVKAKTMVVTDRVAYYDKENPDFRLTFDTNLFGRRTYLDFDEENTLGRLIPEHMVVMELKVVEAVPLWFARLLSIHQIYPSSFSKYGAEYQRYILEGEQNHV